MKENPLKTLEALGQHLWLDFISRAIIVNGGLVQRIEKDGLAGVTSNPTIFEKSIDGTSDYDRAIRDEIMNRKTPSEIARSLMIADITAAADQFRALYEQTNGTRGYVSIEVTPHLAHDAGGTIRDARELWHAINRPNIFIKVPATKEGLPAIRELIAAGINVNVTLLFGLSRYREVVQAYIDGIDIRIQRNESFSHIVSVASFFLSRIDVLVDRLLDERIGSGGEIAHRAASLKGKVALASAGLAYITYKEIFGNSPFTEMSKKGVHPQMLLWASTGTKNPEYPDTMYIDPLIAPETISTQPIETIEAYRKHGNPALRIDQTAASAPEVFDALAKVDINIDNITAQLESEGVEKFSDSYDKLIAALEKKCRGK